MIAHMQQKSRNILTIVLEISRYQHTSHLHSSNDKIILPDPDAPVLPPPSEPDSSCLLDINQLSSKPNNMADCDRSELSCDQEVHNFSGTTTPEESSHNGEVMHNIIRKIYCADMTMRVHIYTIFMTICLQSPSNQNTGYKISVYIGDYGVA